MLHRLKKEIIVYVLVFCTNQILVADVNPFGIALAASAISSGYMKWPIILLTLLGNGMIYANELVNNMVVLIIFSLFICIVEKNLKRLHHITKTMFFLTIYGTVQIIMEYKNLNFTNMLILILEIIIATTKEIKTIKASEIFYDNYWSKAIIKNVVDENVPIPDGMEYVSRNKSYRSCSKRQSYRKSNVMDSI